MYNTTYSTVITSHNIGFRGDFTEKDFPETEKLYSPNIFLDKLFVKTASRLHL